MDVNKYEIIHHIRENAKSKGIYVDFINGHREHLHCLLLLDCDQTLSKVMQLIKGESSYWINKNRIMKTRFEWADEYYGVSVSESDIDKVREYIKNQEVHHRRRTWEEECRDIFRECGFPQDQG
jgi:REP element-mobilizing transposase RayT